MGPAILWKLSCMWWSKSWLCPVGGLVGLSLFFFILFTFSVLPSFSLLWHCHASASIRCHFYFLMLLSFDYCVAAAANVYICYHLFVTVITNSDLLIKWLGVRSLIFAYGENLIERDRSLNVVQYLEGMVSAVARTGYSEKPKNMLSLNPIVSPYSSFLFFF